MHGKALNHRIASFTKTSKPPPNRSTLLVGAAAGTGGGTAVPPRSIESRSPIRLSWLGITVASGAAVSSEPWRTGSVFLIPGSHQISNSGPGLNHFAKTYLRFCPRQKQWAACGRRWPMTKCDKSVRLKEWAPASRFLQK